MMDRATFDAFCDSLPATFLVRQWGDAHVWKVGNETKNKVFALYSQWIGQADAPGEDAVIFKVTPLSFAMLTEEPGISQAPYFAKGQWVRVVAQSPLRMSDLKAYIEQAHRIMVGNLTKKVRVELGLIDPVAGSPP